MIVIQMAMEAEAQPVIERLGLKAGAGFGGLPFVVYEAPGTALVCAGQDTRFGVDLIGTQPATLAAHVAIERWRPRLLLNAGTAGGFARLGADVGDVYLSQAPVVFHDRRIAIPGFDAYGVGSYPCIDASALARELGFKTGVVSSGNALDLPEVDLAMMRASGAVVKEMEAAAVAWVCALHEVDFLAVKGVTDIVDGAHPPEEEFLANLRLTSDRVAEAVERLLPPLSLRLG